MTKNPMMVVTFRGPASTMAELDEEAEHLGWKLIAPKRLTQEPEPEQSDERTVIWTTS